MREKTSSKPCSKCKDWGNCSGKRWFSQSDIRYCRFQILWIIEHFVVCHEGKFLSYREDWPDEYSDSGYTEAPPTQHSVSSHAPFESTLPIVSDVTSRLSRTGKDGRLLVLEVQSDSPLSHEARAALGYISGWREKRLSYSQWIYDVRKGRSGKKITKKSSNSDTLLTKVNQ